GRGFTLVELLVVISIIGIVMSLMLPAVQSAREAARRLACANKLRQISTAVHSHLTALRRFPTGGWGWKWVGDPDRGNGDKQPGGWIFNILPFMEQEALYNSSRGLTGTDKEEATWQMLQTPLADFLCPSRRAEGLFPYLPKDDPQTFNAPHTERAARTDYAINRGDFYVDPGEGPLSYDDDSYDWPDTTEITGIAFVRSMIRIQDITDGTSNTYLVGEKYLNPTDYETGGDEGDDSSLYQGDDPDIARYSDLMRFDKDDKVVHEDYLPPRKDSRMYSDAYCFGSAHPSTWQVSFCDGSVHSISYDIDPELHGRLGNRKDGLVVDKGKL
ncbi:MAG: DUF1559 family PulG-like putative transporter, partial [Thermoguttaceae bacterium]